MVLELEHFQVYCVRVSLLEKERLFTSSNKVVKLISGIGMKAVQKTATETFWGNLSMATYILRLPKLCPTRMTLFYGGRDAMNSIKGSI